MTDIADNIEEDEGSFVAVIIDLNPSPQLIKEGNCIMPRCLDAVTAFSNSHLMLNPLNKIAIIGCHTRQSCFLYPLPETKETDDFRPSDGQYELFAMVKNAVHTNAKKLILNNVGDEIFTESLIAGGMTMALCYVHQLHKQQVVEKKIPARILVITASGDSASQYMNFMNVFFTAQKELIVFLHGFLFDDLMELMSRNIGNSSIFAHWIHRNLPILEVPMLAAMQLERKYSLFECMIISPPQSWHSFLNLDPGSDKTVNGSVPIKCGAVITEAIKKYNQHEYHFGVLIDACVIEKDSGLLQQGCDITGGMYLKIQNIAALLQYLLWIFLPGAQTRNQMILPPRVHVDYRAACFCHRNLIEIGYVCSVCLSIFCTFSPICSTCQTAFKLGPLPTILTKKKKKQIPLRH